MKTMVIFSGGMDSATLLYHLRDQGHELMAIGIDYGQRHAVELRYAHKFCKAIGIPYPVLNLQDIGRYLTGSSQTDRSIPVPHGHYQAETMKTTVVPGRNLLMLAAAASVALANHCDALAYGAHAGDHFIYVDCRPTFIQMVKEVLLNCDCQPLQLLTPFRDWTKGQIVKEGLRLKVPYEHTWTCYSGDQEPCGLCGSCNERIAAFEENGVPDPALNLTGK